MPYQIFIERRAEKTLARLPGKDRTRIAVLIDALSEEPRPPGCQPVKSAPKGTYPIRVGNYRVIYTVLDDERQVVVARVAKRDERTYRGLGG